VTSDEFAELRKLRAKVRELRRANEILKVAFLDSGGQRNTAGGWGACGTVRAAGNAGGDEGRVVAALAGG
jgi:hypothetical protein